MKTETKITLIYTCQMLALLLFALLIYSLLSSATHLQYWVIPILIASCALPIYLASKFYVRQITDSVEKKACQSENAFVRNASHELNNPLTAIQGECEITLLKERSPTEYRSALHRIASETKRMILLMKHLLFLSHGEKEMLQNATEPIPLADFLMSYAQGRVFFSMDNFALTVEANPHLLKMALDNLIGNACKYSGDNPVHLDLRGTVLEIADEGIGIPEDELSNIYQPFYRASNTREYVGNGIGLSLAIRILNFYGARVAITSTVNKGTTVIVDFS